MGSGVWSRDKFADYSRRAGRSVTASGDVSGNYSAQEMFKSRGLDPALNVSAKIRECRDSVEHPSTVPVILALDVTGSMGSAAVEVAKKLNTVMTTLYDSVGDVEFLIMGIGDLECDRVPVQVSQFESDIRIAEQLDMLYFEGGGGGNCYESYTAAWYFALNHTSLDCHSRGKKGLIITMGDEPINPYLPKEPLNRALGCNEETDIETDRLYTEVTEKFEVYHLAVIDRLSSGGRYKDRIMRDFGKYMDNNHLRQVNLDSIAGTIVDIVTAFAAGKTTIGKPVNSAEEMGDKENSFFGKLISW